MWIIKADNPALKALGWRDDDGAHHHVEFGADGTARCTQETAEQAVSRYNGVTAHETKPGSEDMPSDPDEPTDEEIDS